MVTSWKDKTSNFKKLTATLAPVATFLSGVKKSQYENLSDQEKRLFDKLTADRFGKKENIINNIESVANKALYIFGVVWIVVEFSSDLGLIQFGAIAGVVAFSLLFFSALMMLAAAIYKKVLIRKKDFMLQGYKASSNKHEHTQNNELESKKNNDLEKAHSVEHEITPEHDKYNKVEVVDENEEKVNSHGLLVAFESIQELQEAVTQLRDKFNELEAVFAAQPQFSTSRQYSNIREQCKLYIANSLDLLSEDSIGVIVDSMVKTYVDQEHSQYSNLFLRGLAFLAKGGEPKSKDDQYQYLNDKKSQEFKKKAKGLLSVGSLHSFSDASLLTLEIQYRNKISSLKDSVLLLEDINGCLSGGGGDSKVKSKDLSCYETALQDIAQQRCSHLSSGEFATEETKEDGFEENVTMTNKNSLIKSPLVDAVAVISSVAKEREESFDLFPRWSALHAQRQRLDFKKRSPALKQGDLGKILDSGSKNHPDESAPKSPRKSPKGS